MEQVLLLQNGDKTLIKSQKFENENELQEIIKSNPNLINLSSIFRSPLMIIGRETEYIDVLAITADAVPVVIECKRKENPDMRYLIAQILEYASKLQMMSYRDFDQNVSNYFNSEKCDEELYKKSSLQEAFRKFADGFEDSIEPFDEKEFINNVTENLKDGEFYLVVVVDKISEPTLRTVNFLNKKLEKLRIEVIEISKYSDDGFNIFVPKHVNDDKGITPPRPGIKTLEEMLKDCGDKEAKYITEIYNQWVDNDDYSINMGTKGFSARYKNVPVFFVLPNHFRIAPTVKKKYNDLFFILMKLLEKHFDRNLEVGVSFSSSGFGNEKIASFIKEVKDNLGTYDKV